MHHGFLCRVAEDQGYLIMAMDWRGMSSFDMPVVMKSLLAKPALLQSTRDNLIQGYAGKLVLQHFAQDPRFLEQEWLQFSSDNKQHEIPTYDNKPPISIFYGSSQGGILGAAYTALLGPTGLIKRGILGTPGTSFSSIMYQSNSFSLYDALLMQNFYNNREVRIVLSILQLAWDPAGPASFLAPPIQEPYPPMLLQSGLGDPVIPTMATEALARAYNASVLPSNPRLTIFQIPKASLTSALSNEKSATSGQPHVAWTEILYQNEYQGIGTSENLVHECLRQDCALIGQMSEFINTGRILDPCFNDRCLRKTIPCYLKGKSNSKPTDWTCAYDQCS